MIFVALLFALVAIAFIPLENEGDLDLRRQVTPRVSDYDHCITEGEVKTVSVSLEYGVSKGGRPEAIRVLESDDPCFDNAVIRSVKRWRYKPKMVDGQRVPHDLVRTSVTFDVGEAE